MTQQEGPIEAIKNLVREGTPPAPSPNGHGIPEDIGEEVEHYTDLRLAHRLVAIHGANIRYCHLWNTWLIWNGQQWARDDAGRIDSLTQDVVMSLYTEAAAEYEKSVQAKADHDANQAKTHHERAESLYKWAERSEAAPRLAAAEKIARNQTGITVRPKDLDKDSWVLNVLNGTIDLRTGELKEHDQTQMITKIAPVQYDPDAKLELWDRFLGEAIPNEETLAYVQRCVGATIVGEADDDILLVCHGPGGTGKGTFLNALQRSLADYAAAADLTTFTTARDSHGPQPDLARLQGRRMVAISEVEVGGAMALLKRASGGDPIVTRSHHQETFEFFPQFTIWMICNDRPRVPHDDSGMWRRIREIPFIIKFTNPDTTVRSTLTNPSIAGGAIIAWAVSGCLAWQKEGIAQLPSQVIEATDMYREEMDPLADWLEDNCVLADDSWTPFKSLFTDFGKWAKESNIKYPLGRKKFAQQLKGRFVEMNRPHHGGRGYRGLGTKTGFGNTSEMLRTPESEVLFQIEPHVRINQQPHVTSVTDRHELGVERNVPAGTTLGNISPNEMFPPCDVCGKDDYRYIPEGDGEMECSHCNPE